MNINTMNNKFFGCGEDGDFSLSNASKQDLEILFNWYSNLILLTKQLDFDFALFHKEIQRRHTVLAKLLQSCPPYPSCPKDHEIFVNIPQDPQLHKLMGDIDEILRQFVKPHKFKIPYVKESFEDGLCPECGTDIPDNAMKGDACSHCYYVF